MRDLTLGHQEITKRDVFIPASLRARHLYVIGKTGVGKSTFFHRLLFQDAKRPTATILFDAGDLAPDLFQTLPDRLLERVAYFTIDRPIPYNPLLRRHRDLHGPQREAIIARIENELFALVDQVVAEGSSTAPLSARMKRLLSTALREVMNRPDPSLATLATYLDKEAAALGRALNFNAAELTMSVSAILDRLSPFLRDPRIRRVIANGHDLDFGDMIDSGKILLVSLSGLERAFKRFLGTLLFSGLQSTILERAKPDRRDAAVYVDEFHDYIASTYAAENFQELFAQGRKYRLALSVAHTDFGQMPTGLLHTIHSTVGSAVCFACGDPESRAMCRHFGKNADGADLYPAHLLSFLEDYTAVARVGNSVFKFKTYAAPSRKREIQPYTEPLPPDPPDPLHVAVDSAPERQPYARARAPRPKTKA